MREVVNVSLSHQANHLNTHFYNAQESYINYSGGKKDQPVDLNVFNDAVVSANGKSVSYSPRLMLWDMRNGFGALDEQESYDEALVGKSRKIYETYGIETWNDDASKIEQVYLKDQKKPKKSDYQVALDQLEIAPEVNAGNTAYWSDYSRMIYSPKSFNTLKNWRVDPVKYPRGILKFQEDENQSSNAKIQTFSNFDLGTEEWKQDGFNLDYLDDKFRIFLESSDNLAGINVTTECDSGWGGIANELLPLVKDEYLPKTTIFSWGLYDNVSNKALKPYELLSRIKSTLSLVENSSIFFPISVPSKFPGKFFNNDGALESRLRQSTWYTTGLQSLPYDTLMSLFANDEEEYSMNEIEMGLNMGSKRNIVTGIETSFGSHNDYIDDKFAKLDFTGRIFNEQDTGLRRPPHIFTRNLVVRPPASAVADFDESLVIDKFGRFTDLNSNHGVSVKGLMAYSNPLSLKVPDTFPIKNIPINPTQDSVSSAISISTVARNVLLEYKKKVSFLLRKNSDEKEELVDQLATIAQEYEWGFEDDDDDDDDFY